MDCSLVGAGSVAEHYLADIEDTPLTLAAVCDRERNRAEALAHAHDATAYNDIAELLDAEPSPLVVNLTSHASHAEVTRAALDAGRHVFSEKPLALDGKTARDLITLAEQRGLGLGCAPINHRGSAQRRAATLLADGRTSSIKLASAYAHVGRVTDWHHSPESFLHAGPLYDGAVYPLSLLVSWFGPVERVRSADAVSPWPNEEPTPARPTHVEATVSFAEGPFVRLTASFYAPHRSREFYGLELHGDNGSLYLQNTGALADDHVMFGRIGRNYTTVPPQHPVETSRYIDGPTEFAAKIRAGHTPRKTARRSAHVVAVCNAIEAVAESASGRTIPTPNRELTTGRRAPIVRPERTRNEAAIRLPPIGFGCSRYRDGEYVDRRESIVTALDAGYRLLDSAELYGNETRIGEILAAPGTPDRSSLHITSKVWNTNHGHIREACETTLEELGLDALDSSLLHWPDAWAYQGPLTNLAERPVEEQERLTFPRDPKGDIETAAVTLREAWRDMERLTEHGHTRTIGICNVSKDQLEAILSYARVPPAIVQIERHPYDPREDLVAFCHRHGIRVIAHSPLPASVLAEPVVQKVADERGLSPAQVILAWNVGRGVVPIPSSTNPTHITENAAAAIRLSEDEYERLDALRGEGE